MIMTQPDGLKAARKIKVGGIGHIGDYCVVKYGSGHYVVWPAGSLFSGACVCTGDLHRCVSEVYRKSGEAELRVIIDNN